MSTRMLIDARHSEETRVTIVRGSRVEEFDYESASRRQLKGNIYLARVTRVEPSLQAAFVEYGGNRHGFLAFSEIHPDYYQIPVEDREELLREESEALADEDTDAADDKESKAANDTSAADENANADAEDLKDDAAEADDDDDDVSENTGADDDAAEAQAAAADRRRALRAIKRKYSIQEVIKKRQVLLIQVVKEERGNKGAALTTYLSLAGRYCVLMPNSTHNGGISRKISSATDRKRLKTIISSLEVPNEMGLIVRTAGMSRTKTEIKRDYEYLMRLWGGIRELTLQSIAPALIYEEADLIRRTIRDLYARDMDEILVEGETGYRAAKDFMKLLVPSHAKKVKHYKDRIPLFHRYQVETQLESMFQPIVHLRSGGYIVINPTEALISVDVNSGRSTREHNIEGTALKTNLEAAEEVARQLKLRDMAGLVVIDFIDMEDRANNRAVERRMKEVLKTDRARVQVGKISSFGLMEMSRQRLRPNLIEASMTPCPHCHGTGLVRSLDSAALLALRQLEEEGIRGRSRSVRITSHPDVATFLLNVKRQLLIELEEKYEISIEIVGKVSLGQSEFEMTRIATGADEDDQGEVVVISANGAESPAAPPAPPVAKTVETPAADDDEKSGGRRRRRRRRRGRRGEGDDAPASSEAEGGTETGDEQDGDKPKRRRGRRGGRRRNAEDQIQQETGEEMGATEALDDNDAASDEAAETAAAATPRRRRRRARKPEESSAEQSNAGKASETADSDASVSDTKDEAKEVDAKPKRTRRPRKKPEDSLETATDGDENVELPKKRARRTKKAVTETDKSAEMAEKATDNAPVKPKKPATRKSAPKKTGDAEAAPVSKAEGASTRSEAAPSAVAPAPVEPSQAAPAEGAGPAADSPEDPNRPKRKGWWQRTFG